MEFEGSNPSGVTISRTAANACRVLTLEKRTCCATTQVYGFDNYPTKNKLYRDYMDLSSVVKLPPMMHCVLSMWLCGKAVYKNGKVNERHFGWDEQMCRMK